MSGLENLRVLFFIKQKKLLKSGEAQIFARIYLNDDKSEFAIKKTVLPKYWNAKKMRVSPKCVSSEEINVFINHLVNKVATYAEIFEMDGMQVTAKLLSEKIAGVKEKRRTILAIFKEHNENAHKLIGKDFAPETVLRYETCLKHTKEFIKWSYKRDDMALSEVTPSFVQKFEFYLKTERNCAHNTATKYLKNFKKIVRIALANRWMANDPFSSIKFRLEKVDAIFLNKSELEKIRYKNFSCERLERVRDVFLFCCYTGLAFSDVRSLKEDHISIDDNGIKWIHKKRVKTDQLSIILMIDAAKALIEKYKNHPDVFTKGVLLPVPSNQKMNAYLKEIADLCGVDKPISTHTARHTFATTVTLGNNMPIEVVSKALGHSSINMTQRYARITEDLISKNMSKITDF